MAAKRLTGRPNRQAAGPGPTRGLDQRLTVAPTGIPPGHPNLALRQEAARLSSPEEHDHSQQAGLARPVCPLREPATCRQKEHGSRGGRTRQSGVRQSRPPRWSASGHRETANPRSGSPRPLALQPLDVVMAGSHSDWHHRGHLRWLGLRRPSSRDVDPRSRCSRRCRAIHSPSRPRSQNGNNRLPPRRTGRYGGAPFPGGNSGRLLRWEPNRPRLRRRRRNGGVNG